MASGQIQITPTVTVVIPVRNRARIVTATLNSVFDQDIRPVHVVVVDNGSTDGTFSVINRWIKAHSSDPYFATTLVREPTPGPSAARNRGLKEVSSPYVMFFDSDDLMSPGHVRRVSEAFEADNSIDIAGWDINNIDINNRSTVQPFADSDMLFRHLFNCILGTVRYAVRTDFIRRAGGWNETLTGWEDYELGMRLLMLHPKVRKLTGPLTVTVLQQHESISGTGYSHRHRAWEKSLDACESSLASCNISSRPIQLRRAVLAALYGREHSHHAPRLLTSTLSKTASPIDRLILRAAYYYTRLGGRGIHHLLRPWLRLHTQSL